MKIVIDSNRVVAALLKDSTTRGLLLNASFEFIAPDFIKEEVEKYRGVFVKKAKISVEDFDLLLSMLFESIKLIPKEEYASSMYKLISEISDPKDIPYLACSIAMEAEGIWTHDLHLKEQTKVRIFTNIDLLNSI